MLSRDRIVTRVALAALIWSAACGPSVGAGGAAVGGTCTGQGQCEQRCLLGDDHYPGGLCTYSCASDAQCPAGSVCIDDHGGICGVACVNNDQCAGFGRGFTCDAVDRKGAAGGTLVCRVP